MEEGFCPNEALGAINDPESPTSIQEEEKDTVKPSNKRKKAPEKLIIKKNKKNVPYEQDGDSEDEDDYGLCLSNVPTKVETSDVDNQSIVGGLDKRNEDKAGKVIFCDSAEFNIAIKTEDEEKINKETICVKSSGSHAEFNDDTSLGTEASSQSLTVADEDVQNSDPLGLYGLKLEFLESLGIIPPLDRWVHVNNFRCDKFELRDVMELAGQVLSCSLINIKRRYAKVQYSHPLEAVQAVSMLNGQMYFGLPLKVSLEKNPKNDIILPKGLVNIGLGLGLQGRPVRDIAKEYKKYSKREQSEINPILFRKVNDESRTYNDDDKPNSSQMDVAEFVASSKTSTFTNDRPFNIKHVEDLDSNGDGKEKSAVSPESHSDKSVGSPVSNHGAREDEPNDLKVTSASTVQDQLVQDVQGNSGLPLSLSRVNTGVSVSRSNIPQNRPFRPQISPAVSYRPYPPVSHVQQANVQYTGPFKPVPCCNSVPNHIPTSMVNQSHQGSGALPPPYVPMSAQGSAASGPIIRPGSVNIPRSGPINVVGNISGPVALSGSEPVSGSGPSGPGPAPIRGPSPAHIRGAGPVPIRGPGPSPIRGPGPTPIRGPGPTPIRGLGPVPGQVPRPALASSGIVHGPQSVAAIGSVTATRPGPAPVTSLGPANSKFGVQFSNLPPTTTFPFLCEMLSHCGQMLSLQFTTPGCAVAAFSHPAHAERCFQTYNAMLVEGYRISVTLV